jgi:hypothetical protein
MSSDSARLGAIVRQLVGECHICGCHGDSCATGGGDRCVWMTELRTLCSNPRCIQVDAIQRKRHAREARQRKVRLGAFRTN